jgi:hypothetical protein
MRVWCVAQTAILCLSCFAGEQPDGEVPEYGQALTTLSEAQEDALCDSLVRVDNEQGLERAELCILLLSQRQQCSEDAVLICEEDLVVEQLRDCPFDREVARRCSLPATTMTACLLAKLEDVQLLRPFECGPVDLPQDPAACDEAEAECPGLLFPAYKFISLPE